jgi:hypothetical protein
VSHQPLQERHQRGDGQETISDCAVSWHSAFPSPVQPRRQAASSCHAHVFCYLWPSIARFLARNTSALHVSLTHLALESGGRDSFRKHQVIASHFLHSLVNEPPRERINPVMQFKIQLFPHDVFSLSLPLRSTHSFLPHHRLADFSLSGSSLRRMSSR